MKAAAVSLLAVLTAFAKPATSCVELQGIVPDGGEGLLDLLFLLSPEKSLGNPLAPLDIFTNPIIPGVSELMDAVCRGVSLVTLLVARVATM